MTIRVLLADEHVMLRQSLRALLDTQSDLVVVGEADNGRDTVDLVAEVHPNVVLLDLAMPGLDAIRATQRVHDEHPEVRIVILVGAEDEAAVLSAVSAGAVGVVSTNDSIEAPSLAGSGHRSHHRISSSVRAAHGVVPGEVQDNIVGKVLPDAIQIAAVPRLGAPHHSAAFRRSVIVGLQARCPRVHVHSHSA
jgi:DNA-binding NarL/FixJ family response regulator